MHVSITECVRVVRSSPVQCAPEVERASTCGQRTRHRLRRFEAIVALEGMDLRVVVWVLVGQNLLGMNPGNELHASVEIVDRLQWLPEGQLAVLKTRVLNASSWCQGVAAPTRGGLASV